MENNYTNFKTYTGYENKYVIENSIRYKEFDTVLKAFTKLDDAIAYMDKYNLWDSEYDVILGIDESGKVFPPIF